MHTNPSYLHGSPEPRILSGGIYRAVKGQDFPLHSHTVWEFVYYLSGNPVCPVGDAVYEALPGTLLVTPPSTLHCEFARTDYSVIFFTVEAPADYPWEVRYEDEPGQSIGQTCRALLAEISNACTTQEEEQDRRRMTDALLTRLDLLMKRRCVQGRRCSRKEVIVQQAEQIMEAGFGDRGFGVEQVAIRVNVSVSTLRAAFTEVRGHSPRESLSDLRLQRALAVLRTSDLKLEAVARLCGFDSASHLSRRTKESLGVSPGSLRNSSPDKPVRTAPTGPR